MVMKSNNIKQPTYSDKDLFYKCFYKDCHLMYSTIYALRKHVVTYKHSNYFDNEVFSLKCPYRECCEVYIHNNFFPNFEIKNLVFPHLKRKHSMVKEDIYNILEAVYECVIEYKNNGNKLKVKSRNKEVVHKKEDVIINMEDMQNDNGVLKNIFSTIFFNSVIYIGDIRNKNLFYCRLNGCGKSFNSLTAYKYHCFNFYHSLKHIFLKYDFTIELQLSDIIDLLREKYKIKDKFLIEGIHHHSMYLIDHSYPIKFSLDPEAVSKKRKEKTKIKESKIDCTKILEGLEQNNNENMDEEKEDIFNSIILKGKKYKLEGKIEDGLHTIECINQEITASCKIKNLLWVATTEMEIHEKRMFEFKEGKSQIIVFKEKEKIKEYHFEHGYIRKIEYVDKYLYLLFNDGILRVYTLNIADTKENHFDEEIFKRNFLYQNINLTRKSPTELYLEYHKDIEIKNIMDFCVSRNKIFLCDGLKFYKIIDNKIVKSTDNLDYIIISIACNMEENPNIFFIDVCGKLFCFDENFENERVITSVAGYTLLKFIPEYNYIFISDTFNGIAKIFKHPYKKSIILKQKMISAIDINQNCYLTGLYNGSVYFSYHGKKTVYFEKVLKCIKRKNYYVLCTTEQEFNFLKEKDKGYNKVVSVVDTYFYPSYVVILYTNGIVCYIDQ
ncbi:hypothetical protein SLOPH_1852 [Spraguea lophii 42_110]|uniref:C2H2-type domain-containing protein n=1 Tax=Spraguea lophii (strain 42_110) TaxID=1358809 RepID=S7XJT1_SPRLO|nr:hypothetical protein SLOPH_1852 [Spraguea lophii 42_110]